MSRKASEVSAIRASRNRGVARSRTPRRKTWKDLVTEDWQKLNGAPAEIINDAGIIGDCCRLSGGEALKYASEELRSDKEFVLGAAQELGACILLHAAEMLRADRDFVMEVMEYCPPSETLQFVVGELRQQLLNDRDFLLQAVQEVGTEVLEQCSETMLGDRDFMLAVADYVPPGEALQYATPALRKELFADQDFVLQAIKSAGADVLEEASQELLGSREFMLAASDLDDEALAWATAELQEELCPGKVFTPRAPREDWPDMEMVGPTEDPGTAMQEETQPIYPLLQPPPPPPPPATHIYAPPSTKSRPSTPPMPQMASAVPAVPFAAPCPKATLPFPSPPCAVAAPLPPLAPLGAMPPMGLMQPLPPLGVPMPPLQGTLLPQANAALHRPAEYLLPVPPLAQPQAAPASTSLSPDAYAVAAAVAAKAAAPAPAPSPPTVDVDKAALLAALRNVGAQALEESSQELAAQMYNDRDFVLQAVRDNGARALERASMELRSNEPFMLEAAKHCASPGELLEYASDALRLNDQNFLLKAVEELGEVALGFADKALLSNRDFLLAAAKRGGKGEVLRYAPEALRTELRGDREILTMLVQENGPHELKTAPLALRSDKAFMLEVARKCPIYIEALQYASEDVQALLFSDRQFMIQAVRDLGVTALKHAAKNLKGSKEFILEVAQASSAAYASRYADEEVRTELFRDQAFLLQAVKESGPNVLKLASMELRSNRQFMIAAAAFCPPGQVFRFASDDLRGMLFSDRSFMLTAIKEVGPKAFAKAADELKNDKDFVLAAAKVCPTAEVLRHTPEAVKSQLYDDRDFMIRAVGQMGATVLARASANLRGDLGFMIEVSSSCAPGEAMRYATAELQDSLAESPDSSEPEAAG